MYTENCWSQQRCVKIPWGSDFPNVTWEGRRDKRPREDVKDLGPLVWQRGQKGEVVELLARVNLQNQGTIWMGGSETNLVWSWWTSRACTTVKEMVFATDIEEGANRKCCIGLLVFWVLSWSIQERKEDRESWKHRMVSVGRDPKNHLVPTPKRGIVCSTDLSRQQDSYGSVPRRMDEISIWNAAGKDKDVYGALA